MTITQIGTFLVLKSLKPLYLEFLIVNQQALNRKRVATTANYFSVRIIKSEPPTHKILGIV